MSRWPAPAAVGELIRLVVIPVTGVVLITVDRPLTPLAAGAYVAMMGLPATALVDLRRERKDGPTQPPSGRGDTGPI